jgi:hypothetical protein
MVGKGSCYKGQPRNISNKGRTIAGYLNTLRHNDFLRSISQRYDHSFGFSPILVSICISTSGNVQNILIFSTLHLGSC